MRANTDGTNVETVVSGTSSPAGLALDLRGILIGACCDTAPGSGGNCIEVDQYDCPEAEFTTFTFGATCANVTCDERGSCCARRTGTCSDNVFQQDCADPDAAWSQGAGCALAGCSVGTGACCDLRAPAPSQPPGDCSDGMTFAECQCQTCVWSISTTCESIDCPGDFVAVPAMSLWGQIFQVVLVLVLAGISKARRGDVSSR